MRWLDREQLMEVGLGGLGGLKCVVGHTSSSLLRSPIYNFFVINLLRIWF